MTDTLLQSLREHMLDESEPLAGLLRKCLLLGAETGSGSLREWARRELNGYGDEEEAPEYRKIPEVPISVDSVAGNTWIKGQTLNRLQLPEKAREHLPESLSFKQPIEELERLAEQKSLTFGSPGLAYARTVWNRQLGPFENIVGLSYVLTGSVLAGMLGQIRTQLVDIIADLTSGTPLSELPNKARVDAAVNARVGQARDVYNTTIHEAKGATAIGGRATATAEGISVENALKMLGEVQQAASDLEAGRRAELEAAVVELREAIDQESPDTGEVVKNVGKLRAAAAKLGVVAITTAANSATQAVTELAVSGVFN